MDKKKKILWVSEASFLNTGFSTLSKEILQRLYDTNKYDLVEYASYVRGDDPRGLQLPWKFYGAIPLPNDKLGNDRYNGSLYGQFGEALFEQVCLQEHPDIVFDVRDHWMVCFEERSPFRPYYKLIWMPTIDGAPQRLEWLDDYSKVDKLLTYSQFGKDTLLKEAPHLKVDGVVRPGVNHDLYKPLDKKALRRSIGLSEDSNIILTVMRNQKRKLFPDLLDTFAEFLNFCVKNNNEKLAKKTYLFLHTSYPDVGYDLASHILRTKLGHKVLLTYVCEKCKAFYPDFLQGELTTCKNCGSLAAHCPNTQHGLSREQLVFIYNVADLYIQYSIAEGLGMGIPEAKACGVPAMAVDHSAMTEQVQVEGCAIIKKQRGFYEAVIETEQNRALPDNLDAAHKIYNFFTASPEKRAEWSRLARKDASENYSFDRATKVLMETFDSCEVNDHKDTWLSKPKLINIPTEFPNFNSPAHLVDWCIDNLLCQPKLKNSYFRNQLIKDLNIGYNLDRGGRQPFGPNQAIDMFVKRAQNQNFWEQVRTQKQDQGKISWIKV